MHNSKWENYSNVLPFIFRNIKLNALCLSLIHINIRVRQWKFQHQTRGDKNIEKWELQLYSEIIYEIILNQFPNFTFKHKTPDCPGTRALAWSVWDAAALHSVRQTIQIFDIDYRRLKRSWKGITKSSMSPWLVCSSILLDCNYNILNNMMLI